MKPYYQDKYATIYNGDCVDIMGKLDGGFDLVLTDPPYGLGFPYLEYIDTRDSLSLIIKHFIPMAKKMSSRVYVLCGPTQICMYPQSDWVISFVWNTTGSFGKYGYNQWTPVLCYGKDIKGFGSINGVLKSDVIKISGGGGVGFMRSQEEKMHTCPKPITIMDGLVKRLSNEGDKILDPFCGSGTTLVSASKAKRRSVGIEITERYCEIAAKRLSQEVLEF